MYLQRDRVALATGRLRTGPNLSRTCPPKVSSRNAAVRPHARKVAWTRFHITSQPQYISPVCYFSYVYSSSVAFRNLNYNPFRSNLIAERIMESFAEITAGFDTIKKLYDHGVNPLDAIRDVGQMALSLIIEHPRRGLDKEYIVFGSPDSPEGVTRPIRSDLFIPDASEYASAWNAMVSTMGTEDLNVASANAALYTCIQSFAGVYDLYKRGARKTPGTFFEIMVGSLLSEITGSSRGKQVTLNVGGESVTIPTDIYFEDYNLVVATKTSSRDRIIQPWSHQLLLDRITERIGYPPFTSILCLVGEVQLGKTEEKPCYQVCVPNQVKLYQEHVAKLAGLYYLDPPAAYLALHDAGIITVATIGTLLTGDLLKTI